MDILVIALTAFFASGLTLFSGFGLGTILMPAFALFFPIETAIGLTAVVHFLNNIFKFVMVGRLASTEIVLKFGVPALAASFLGAQVLLWADVLGPLGAYSLGGRMVEVRPIGLAVGLLMVVFAWLEVVPAFRDKQFDRRYLSWGGSLSGFFGGISGHQGALRSMFLLKAELSKESFIATGIVIACLVDVARLIVYGKGIPSSAVSAHLPVLFTAVLAAFLGAYLGNRLVPKVTVGFVQRTVLVMVTVIGVLLMSGLI